VYLRHDAAIPGIYFLTFPNVQDNAVNAKDQAYPPSMGPVMNSFVLEI